MKTDFYTMLAKLENSLWGKISFIFPHLLPSSLILITYSLCGWFAQDTKRKEKRKEKKVDQKFFFTDFCWRLSAFIRHQCGISTFGLHPLSLSFTKTIFCEIGCVIISLTMPSAHCELRKKLSKVNLKFSIAANFPGTCELFPMCQDIFWIQPWFPVRPWISFFSSSSFCIIKVGCYLWEKIQTAWLIWEDYGIRKLIQEDEETKMYFTAFLFTPTCWSVLWAHQLYFTTVPAPLQLDLSGDEVFCWWTHTFIGTDKCIYINCSSGSPVGLAVV